MQWECRNCGIYNLDYLETCRNCGAGKDGRSKAQPMTNHDEPIELADIMIEEPVVPVNNASKANNISVPIFCTQCGSQLYEDAKFCAKCGVPVRSSLNSEGSRYKISEKHTPSSSPSASYNAIIGEPIGLTEIEPHLSTMQNLYEAIIGEKNRIYYLTKFEQFDRQGPGLKISWNWPAFLCGPWVLYRKMYGWVFASLGISLLSSIFIKSGLLGVGIFVALAYWVAFPIFANSLYYGSIKKKIAVAQHTIKDESRLLEYLQYRGGVNTWVIWVSVLLPVIGILAAILIPQFARH